MYETLQAQIQSILSQVRFLSFQNLWILCSHDCQTDAQKRARYNELQYHLTELRSRKMFLMSVPDYRNILYGHAMGYDMDAIKQLANTNSYTIRAALEAAKKDHLTWSEAQDMTNGQIEARLFQPKDIFIKTRSQLPLSPEARHIINLSATVMCSMSKHDELETILYLQYPTMMFWLSRIRTENGEYIAKTFDVTVITRDNIEAIAMILPQQRRLSTPNIEMDFTHHIAVIPGSKDDPTKPDAEFFSYATSVLPPFNSFAVISPDGQCRRYKSKNQP